MLTNLFINKIILIDRLDIPFEGGFCVLTGETGAGKSILLDALGLALGQRASPTFIRSGEKQGSVTATFDIADNPELKIFLSEEGIAFEDALFLRRVIYNDGKTKSFINDTPVSLNLLNEIAGKLIEIHGQNDQRGLFNIKTHGIILDHYGKLENLLFDTNTKFEQYSALKKELSELKENESRLIAEEEYLKFVKKELEELNLHPGLEDELATRRNRLINREKLIETLNHANACISDGNIEDNLRNAQTALIRNAELNSKFNDISETIERAIIEINEAVSELNAEADNMDSNDDNLEEIEQNLFAIRDASRKYNTPSDKLALYRDEIAEKLSLISNKDKLIADLTCQVSKALGDYIKSAEQLSNARKKTAIEFEKALSKELAPLKMENTKLKVQIDKAPEEYWSSNGIDKISFLVSTNPGSPFAPIAKIASGGELSRFMLALKVILLDVKSLPTMIFDEVDVGIGGAVADAVGKRLGALGKKLQVFAITHQPQVASKGNCHLKVSKNQTSQGTIVNVSLLSEDERQEELARMLAGEKITQEARAAAGKLMQLEEAYI